VTLPEELRTLRLCGNSLPETLTLFPPLTVRFVTNDVTSGVGYKGSYHFVKASGMFNYNISDDNNTEAEIMVCVENRALSKVLTVNPGHPISFPPPNSRREVNWNFVHQSYLYCC